jgi:hypothetical protein
MFISDQLGHPQESNVLLYVLDFRFNGPVKKLRYSRIQKGIMPVALLQNLVAHLLGRASKWRRRSETSFSGSC